MAGVGDYVNFFSFKEKECEHQAFPRYNNNGIYVCLNVRLNV